MIKDIPKQVLYHGKFSNKEKNENEKKSPKKIEPLVI